LLKKYALVNKIKSGEIARKFKDKLSIPSEKKKRYADLVLWRIKDLSGLRKELQTKNLIFFRNPLQNKLIKREDDELVVLFISKMSRSLYAPYFKINARKLLVMSSRFYYIVRFDYITILLYNYI
jgi:hypothetical protein